MGAHTIRRMAVATMVLVAGTLTACGDDAAPTTTAAATTDATTTTQAATTSSDATTTVAPGNPTLVLAPDGLLLATPGGSTTPLPFGSDQETVMTALVQVLGAPTENGPGTAECPNGQDWVAVWPDTILVGFQGGTLLTWSLRPDSTLTDMAGIGIGSGRGAVEASWSITVQDTSLGVEFFTANDGSGYGGVFSDSSPSAVVTNLWSGPSCIFR